MNNNERGAALVSKELQLEFEQFWQQHAAAKQLRARDLLLRSACPQLCGMCAAPCQGPAAACYAPFCAGPGVDPPPPF